ncbi:hypothetical protein GCK72_007027 [Caenorhabditis remanei]|uniref:Uncharacterized protein n=1 Tax=Caenorhabditis remanei TaxID=31234 RepID=A0A6A5HI42_CAERE|nr:hypothetical protein GCK72_007027 [Caenorhabditis remanei]KAF1767069.1 hypothetical protein GCK72_007027 [Caenorhabditis remanei]
MDSEIKKPRLDDSGSLFDEDMTNSTSSSGTLTPPQPSFQSYLLQSNHELIRARGALPNETFILHPPPRFFPESVPVRLMSQEDCLWELAVMNTKVAEVYKEPKLNIWDPKTKRFNPPGCLFNPNKPKKIPQTVLNPTDGNRYYRKWKRTQGVSANELSNEEVEEARRLYTKVIEEFGKQARLGFIEAIPMTKQIELKKMERAGKNWPNMADEPKDPGSLDTKILQSSHVVDLKTPDSEELGSGNNSAKAPFPLTSSEPFPPTSSDSVLDFNYFQNQFHYDRYVSSFFPADFATPQYLRRLLSGVSNAPEQSFLIDFDLNSSSHYQKPTLSNESQFYFPSTIPRINVPNIEVKSLSDLLKTLPSSMEFMTLEEYGTSSDSPPGCDNVSRESRPIPEVVKTIKTQEPSEKSSSAPEEHWEGFQSCVSFIEHIPLPPLTKLGKDEVDPPTKVMTKDEINWELAKINAGQEEVYLNPKLSLLDKTTGKRVSHPCLFNIEGPRQFPQFVPRYPKGYQLLRAWKKSIGDSLETITGREKIEFISLAHKLAVEHRKQRKRGWIETIPWMEWKIERKKQQKSRKPLIREADSTMEVDEDSPGTSSDMT